MSGRLIGANWSTCGDSIQEGDMVVRGGEPRLLRQRKENEKKGETSGVATLDHCTRTNSGNGMSFAIIPQKQRLRTCEPENKEYSGCFGLTGGTPISKTTVAR